MANGTDNQENQTFDQVREGAASVNPYIKLFHELGTFGESAVSGAVGGEKGDFVGQVFFNPVGAGLSLLGDDDNRVSQVAREDSAQAARLREIDRTRRQIAQGTDPLTQQRISEVRKIGETTKGQLAKVGGGDVGGTISSFLRAQRNTGQGINQAFSQSQARQPFFENLSTQLGNRIAQRKLELDINRVDTERAKEAQAQTIENLNRSGAEASGDTGAFGGLLDIIGGQNTGEGGDSLSNIIGGGIGGAIGQGEGSSQSSQGGIFGGGEGSTGSGLGSLLNTGGEGEGSGLINKAVGLVGGLF